MAALSAAQARAVYDRIGRVQDWQFYEDRAIARLVADCVPQNAHVIFEFGCGTGRLAANMLRLLPPTARYLGVDVSPVMVGLATDRLAPWGDRAQVRLVDGSMPLPAASNSADRIVCTYVFDLLDSTDVVVVLDEFERILTDDGRLCLVSLRPGITRFERLISGLWTMVWRHAPQLLGGCRPVRLDQMLARGWTTCSEHVVHSWGLVSEVIVTTPHQNPPTSTP
ncbi:MAG: class I SAM-dependent methyltransferase [Mycobacterium sp.]|nr:class I SAM-dependent methyltransferase [Mycobacterium sp.]